MIINLINSSGDVLPKKLEEYLNHTSDTSISIGSEIPSISQPNYEKALHSFFDRIDKIWLNYENYIYHLIYRKGLLEKNRISIYSVLKNNTEDKNLNLSVDQLSIDEKIVNFQIKEVRKQGAKYGVLNIMKLQKQFLINDENSESILICSPEELNFSNIHGKIFNVDKSGLIIGLELSTFSSLLDSKVSYFVFSGGFDFGKIICTRFDI